ncbi:hypothetical protein KAJ27_01070 [bacterium]|nr:hypothetical protein [bacterium]
MDKHFKIIKNILFDPSAFFRKSLTEKVDMFPFAAVNIGIYIVFSLILDLMQRTESLLRVTIIPVIIVPILFIAAGIFNILCSKYKETSNFDVWLKIVFSATAVLPVLGIFRFFGLIHFYVVLGLYVILGIIVLQIGYHALRRIINVPVRKLGKFYPVGILILFLIVGCVSYITMNLGNAGLSFDYAATEKKILYLGYDKAKIEIEALKHTVKNLELKIRDFQDRGISVSGELDRKLKITEQELKNYNSVFNNINWDE